MNDIVCAEAELTMAANNLVEYADFLARSIESYIAILAEIQNDGIKDNLVCARLSAVANTLLPYKTTLVSESEEIKRDISGYIAAISTIDNFKFPADLTSVISSIVAQFI